MSDPNLEHQAPKNKRRDPSNPIVFLDVTIGGAPAGKIVFELFKNVVPKVQCHRLDQCTRSLLVIPCACSVCQGSYEKCFCALTICMHADC